MIPSLAWVLRFVVFAAVGVSALLLYVFPRRFSGPVTEHERDDPGPSTIWAHVMRYLTPVCATVGMALLLPAHGCPKSIEYTSLTAGGPADGLDPEEPSAQFACVVEAVLARATELAHGQQPEREHLAQAVAERGLDMDCRDVAAVEHLPDAALIESLEITLLVLHAQAGELRSLRVRPGPLYSDFDAWAMAASILDHWTDFDIGLDTRTMADIYRVDRARVQDDHVLVWAVASAAALCGDPPNAVLFIAGTPQQCVLDGVPDVCSVPGDGMVATFAKLDCGRVGALSELEQHQPRAELQWGSAPAVPVSWPRTVGVAVEGDSGIWTEALELARLDARDGGFAADLRNRGYQLPDIDINSRLTLDLSHAEHIEIRSGGGSCTGPAAAGHLALPKGPFSFDGISAEGQVPVRVHDGCVSIAVRPAALRKPSYVSGDAYEATRFYATMGAISWAANCVESGCRGHRPVEPGGGRAYPLLARAEMDEVLGSGSWRDSLGLLLLGLSLGLMVLRSRSNTVT